MIAAALAEERQIVCGEIAECLADALQRQRERGDKRFTL
jgi:hypothetical protein